MRGTAKDCDLQTEVLSLHWVISGGGGVGGCWTPFKWNPNAWISDFCPVGLVGLLL